MYLIEEKDVNMEMKLYNREPLHSNWLKSALNETSALFLMKVTIMLAYQSDRLF